MPLPENLLPKPLNTAPEAPAIAAFLRASFKLPPCIKVPMPDPRAAPYIAPSGVNERAIGRTIGATFLITFATFLTVFFTPLAILEAAFLTPLNTFFIALKGLKNSGIPVSGLIEFAPEPTTYRSGSSIPSSRR